MLYSQSDEMGNFVNRAEVSGYICFSYLVYLKNISILVIQFLNSLLFESMYFHYMLINYHYINDINRS